VKTYEAIVKGENVPEPGVPESFKVLMKELQSLGMDVKILSGDEKEIEMRDFDEDDDLQHAETLTIAPESEDIDSEKVGSKE
jgi:DNA-directed RNA polymerase subunit beta